MPENNPNKIIIRASKELDAVLNLIAEDIRKAVKKYGVKYKEPFWRNNRGLYNAINQIINKQKTKNLLIIQKSIRSGWALSNNNVDNQVIDYIKEKNATQLLESKAYKVSEAKLTGFDIPVWEEWLQTNTPQLNAFLNRSVDGFKLSGRVWNISLKTRKILEKTLQSGILEGKSSAQMTKILRQALKNPNALFRRVRNPITDKLELSKPAKNFHPGRGVYRSAYKNALRLAGTETNMSYRFAEFERIQQVPFIIGYRVHLSNQHPEYDICDAMTGTYPKNFVFLGWHPNCICYTTTIMLGDEKFKKYLDNGTIPSKNYVKKMPSKAVNYIKDNKEKIDEMKNAPYWLRQNENIIDNHLK